ncbi:unnamed protein product [Albugo candida]|uniref:Uncharacterized protein n=1 Tax=Albugo candida TaxID=65357 RepID=A0A024GIB6_9STRA|nr:unnamed protein product [Albugo candida]|eukprot:CCI46426.1 unnamed protein product [Albugo candida]
MVYIKTREQLHLPFPRAVDDIQTIVADFEEFESTDWRLLVVSKAHRSKSAGSYVLKQMRVLHCNHKLLLTDTASNNMQDSWALVNIFGVCQTLQKSMAPYVLCHVEEDVEQSISPGRSIDSIEHESRQCWNQLSKRLQISYGSEMFERASQNIVVEHAVFGSGVFHDGVQANHKRSSNSLSDIETILRENALVCKTDADHRIQKSLTYIAVDWSSLVADTSTGELSVDGPNFREKVLPGGTSVEMLSLQLKDGSAYATNESNAKFLGKLVSPHWTRPRDSRAASNQYKVEQTFLATAIDDSGNISLTFGEIAWTLVPDVENTGNRVDGRMKASKSSKMKTDDIEASRATPMQIIPD